MARCIRKEVSDLFDPETPDGNQNLKVVNFDSLIPNRIVDFGLGQLLLPMSHGHVHFVRRSAYPVRSYHA